MAEQMQRVFAATDTETLVEHILQARRIRDNLLGSSLFSETAWDILLNLYRSHLRHLDLTRDDLGELLGLSTATVGRWIETLKLENLVRQKPHPEQPGQMSVELSTQGANAMRRWSAAWLSRACESGTQMRLSALLDRLSEPSEGHSKGC